MDSRQIEAEAARWLVRSDKPDFSDHAALAAWLASDTAHRVAWLRLKSAWQAASRLHALNQGVEAPTAGPRNFQALRHPARKSPT
ncbi:MAG TPA: DUF4880 domain-containing protein, partial [Rhodanobacteraceae bacterium]|nr:DUF4880 domain-containing protein [Rhodanobacteraceae bacterium]